MAVQTHTATLSVEEYLRVSLEPPCDYVDGHLRERSVGQFKHAALQLILGEWFGAHRLDWNLRVAVEQHVKIPPTRYQVADVIVLRRDRPKEEIITFPPLICIEVLSPDDSHAEISARVDDYLSIGTENIWMIDPYRREGFVCTQTGWNRPDDDRFIVADSPIILPLAEIFRRLDEA